MKDWSSARALRSSVVVVTVCGGVETPRGVHFRKGVGMGMRSSSNGVRVHVGVPHNFSYAAHLGRRVDSYRWHR